MRKGSGRKRERQIPAGSGIIELRNKNATKQQEGASLMKYSTTKTYTLKRSIIEFGKFSKVKRGLSRSWSRHDLRYAGGKELPVNKHRRSAARADQEGQRGGASGTHLSEGVPEVARGEYHRFIREWVPENPTILIDDSDVVKPEGYKFESLGIVRDGSKSTEKKSVYEKGYHVTEAVAITRSKQPVSVFPGFTRPGKRVTFL